MSTIQLTDIDVTQQRIKFKFNDKDISITLTKNFCMWNLKGLEKMNLNFEELVEICNFIYRNRIITASDDIVIHSKNGESIRFRCGKK